MAVVQKHLSIIITGSIYHSSTGICNKPHATLLRRWSEDSMLEDLEVFMAVVAVEEDDEVKLGLGRS